MYESSSLAERIKSYAKTNKIVLKLLFEECGLGRNTMANLTSLGVNAIRQINDTKGMASFSLARIADYLDCSVDYLLGRTDNPNSHKS